MEGPPLGGDQNRATSLLAAFWAPFPLTALLLSLRWYVRVSIKSVGLDDYLMLLSWIIYIASLIVASYQMLHGGARHLYYLSPDQISTVLKLETIGIPLGIMSQAFGKASVAFFILRLMGPATVWRRWFMHINMVLYVLASILDSIFTFIQCSPVKALWEVVPDAKCWNTNIYLGFSIFQSSYGAFMDFYLSLLPITIVWNLQLSAKKRIGLCFLFGMGVFTGVSAIIKTKQLSSFGNHADSTWATYAVWIFSPLEAALIIIFGSIPAVKPLYDWFATGKPIKPNGHTRNPAKQSYRMHKDISVRSHESYVAGNMTNIITRQGTRWSTSENSYRVDTDKLKVERTFEIGLGSRASAEEPEGTTEVPLDGNRV